MLLAAGFFLLAATVLPTMRAGAQDHVVTDANLNQKLASAKTPADHEMIAAYYDTEAAENEKKAELHRASKNIFYKAPNQLHCSELIKPTGKLPIRTRRLRPHIVRWPRKRVAKLGNE